MQYFKSLIVFLGVGLGVDSKLFLKRFYKVAQAGIADAESGFRYIAVVAGNEIISLFKMYGPQILKRGYPHCLFKSLGQLILPVFRFKSYPMGYRRP